MRVICDKNLVSFFSDAKGQKTLIHIQDALPTYINMHSSKIKPIKTMCAIDHLYELKIKKGNQAYRLAYYYKQDIIYLIYVSLTLKKTSFEKELQHYLKTIINN